MVVMIPALVQTVEGGKPALSALLKMKAILGTTGLSFSLLLLSMSGQSQGSEAQG